MTSQILPLGPPDEQMTFQSLSLRLADGPMTFRSLQVGSDRRAEPGAAAAGSDDRRLLDGRPGGLLVALPPSGILRRSAGDVPFLLGGEPGGLRRASSKPAAGWPSTCSSAATTPTA